MNSIDAQAVAEKLAPEFALLAAKMTDIFSAELHGEKIYGSAYVYSPGGADNFEPVGLLGINGEMALMDQTLLMANTDMLEAIATALYLVRPTVH